MQRLNKFGKIFLAVIALMISAIGVSAATFTVTDTNDSGAGSLRQAIIDANATAGTDIINFDANFNVSRTITLTSGEMLMTNGGGITINGPGRNLLTVSGNNQTRAFEINSYNQAITVVVNNLTISNCAVLTLGVGDGVSIDINRDGNTSTQAFSVTDLTLNNAAITNTTVSNSGFYSINSRAAGDITINNSYIGNNNAAVLGTNVGGFAANIAARRVTISNSTIERNFGNNGLISNGGENLIVTNSTINDNTVNNNGSAFRLTVVTGASFNLTNSTVVRNC